MAAAKKPKENWGPNPTFSKKDDPKHLAATVQRLTNAGLQLPQHIVDEGRAWYGNVHDVTQEQSRSRGFTFRQGVGIVAAVSPNMDFKSRNIKALDDLQNLDDSDWEMIARSAAQGQKRLPEVKAMISEKAPSLGVGYDSNLMKARRIMHGEDPEQVLDRRGAPKTNSFFHNILNPHQMGPVTVDGRHFDIVNNRRIPWDAERGIKSADLLRGGRSRYENIEDLTRSVTSHLARRDPSRFGGLLPHEAQAVLWVGGRAIERGGRMDFDPVTGKSRGGQNRKGQPYFNQKGNPHGFDWSASEFV